MRGVLDYDHSIVLLHLMMIAVAIGAVLHFHRHRIPVPYTVAMFILGMFLGAVSLVLPTEWNFVGFFDGEKGQINPSLLFHVFLPLLIFEGSYSIKPFALRRILRHALLLATVGVIVNALLLGAMTLAVLPTWPWYGALLLGSILSATDPVAVVCLLKDLGVTPELTACVDAEALINDGAAIIMFQMLLPAAEENHFPFDLMALTQTCLQLTVLACILGAFCGWVLLKVIYFVRHDEMSVTLCTLAFPYVVYFVADQVVATSGVLTLFTAGTLVARYCPSLFPGKHHGMMQSTWHTLVHALNTLLFTFAGAVCMERIFGGSALSPWWFATIVSVYLACILGRLVMISVLAPVANIRSAWRLDWRAVLVLTHGGLRGGVALILALDLAGEESLPEAFREQFLQLVCGVVMLSSLINATTSGALVQRLQLQAKPHYRHVQMQHSVTAVTASCEAAVWAAKQDPSVATRCNWAEVNRVWTRFENPFDSYPEIPGSAPTAQGIALRLVKQSLFAARDAARCSEAVLATLLDLIQAHLADGTLPDAANDFRLEAFPMSCFANIAVSCAVRCAASAGLAAYLQRNHDVFVASLIHTYAESVKNASLGLQSISAAAQPLGVAAVTRWADRELKSMARLISDPQLVAPTAVSTAITTWVSAGVLAAAKDTVERLQHSGLASQYDAEVLDEGLEETADEVRYRTSSLVIDMTPMTAAAVAFAASPLGARPLHPHASITISTTEPLQTTATSQEDHLLCCSELWELGTATAGSYLPHVSRDGRGGIVGLVVSGVATRADGNRERAFPRQLVASSVWGVDETLFGGGATVPLRYVCVTDVAYALLSRDNFARVCASDSAFASRAEDLAARRAAEAAANELLEDVFGCDCEATHVHRDLSGDRALDLGASSAAAVVFISGADESGLFTAETLPTVLPRCLATAPQRWAPGTVLVEVVLQQHRGPCQLHRAPYAVRRRPAVVEWYDAGRCATLVPLLNAAQLRTVAALDVLALAAASELPATPPCSHPAVDRALDQVLHALCSLVVEVLPLEERLCQWSGASDSPNGQQEASTLLAKQRAAHVELHERVGRWLERRALRDAQLHLEVLDGAATLLGPLFAQDAADIQAVAELVGPARLASLRTASDVAALWRLPAKAEVPWVADTAASPQEPSPAQAFAVGCDVDPS